MDQSKLIKDILLENENLSAHLKRVSKPGFKLHIMDIDVMADKTKLIYEKLTQLQSNLAGSSPVFESEPAKQELDSAPKPAELAKQEISEVDDLETASSQQSEPLASAEPGEDETKLPDIVEPDHSGVDEAVGNAHNTESIPQHLVKEETEVRIEKEEVLVTSEENIQEAKPSDAQNTQSYQQLRVQPQKTTLDLFAEDATESLGDMFSSAYDQSIAERMQKTPIADMRAAIGINEKFLFINELFKGNLNLYNKAIDELNTFQSINGAFTYLIELKVQHQWNEASPAFKRLKELIDRRFS